MRGKLLKTEPISKKFHNVFRFTRRTAEITLKNGQRYKFLRHVLETGPAVSILPHFYDPIKQDWQIVLVRQYRPAIDALCLEAPGGLTQVGKDIRSEMARELLEETGINIKSSLIKVVGKHHLASSFCDQVVHLGTVHLTVEDPRRWKRSLVKNYGLIHEKEFTEVVILPLKQALTKPNLVTYTLAKYQIIDLARRLEQK